MGRIRVCGVEIDDLTAEEAVAAALVQTEGPAVVFTPNAVMLDACRREPELAELLSSATLSLADGVGVLRAARRAGTPLRERVAGIDFGERLLAAAARRGLRVFLLGGRPGVAAEAAERLTARFSGLSVCGVQDGYFEKQGEADRAVLEKLLAARPDILFVCFGFPLQERWIAAHLPALSGLRVVAGLGGSLDVWAGKLRRAPAFLSRMGLEWAWRMLCEPRRLRNLPALVRIWTGK